MAAPETVGQVGDRLVFQESMRLVALPDRMADGRVVKRYMSQRAAWVPGLDLPKGLRDAIRFKGAAFGGHVYCQSGLAASRAFAETRPVSGQTTQDTRTFGIHTIHGYFSETGATDRPFIYEVSIVAANPSFWNLMVSARQPQVPSNNPDGDHYPLADAQLPLGPPCFTALVSFRPSTPSQAIEQEPSPQQRYADILSARPPADWEPAPVVDVAGLFAALPTREIGTFPAVDMKKVDMELFNEDKPLHEKREIILYRLLAPLPPSDPDAHAMVHAFEADRNGLLMCGNHVGYGFSRMRAATLSYSFVVHVNPEDAVMEFGDDQWWVQEASFPRVEAGRCVVMSKIWSPQGKHVATEYQDGIVKKASPPGEAKGKL